MCTITYFYFGTLENEEKRRDLEMDIYDEKKLKII